MSDIQRYAMHAYETVRAVPNPVGDWVTYADHLAAVQQAEERGDQRYIAGHADGYEQGQRDALAAGGGTHYTDCAFLSGGGCNCRPQTSPDGEASTPHATAPVGSETSVAPAGEDYGAPQRIDTVEYGQMRYEQGKRDALAGAVQRVEGLNDPWPTSAPGALPREMVIAAIKGDSDE